MEIDASEKNLPEESAGDLARQQDGRYLPPHPGPLPRGEADTETAAVVRAAVPLFIHWERHVVKRIGVSLDVARGLRERFLEEGKDFARVSNRIVYSEAGVQALRIKARMPAETSGEKAPPGNGTEGVQAVKLVMYRTVPNPRIVLCHFPGKEPDRPENLVRVVVKDSRNFVRGMELEGTRMDQDDLYLMVGPVPRYRGRWM